MAGRSPYRRTTRRSAASVPAAHGGTGMPTAAAAPPTSSAAAAAAAAAAASGGGDAISMMNAAAAAATGASSLSSPTEFADRTAAAIAAARRTARGTAAGGSRNSYGSAGVTGVGGGGSDVGSTFLSDGIHGGAHGGAHGGPTTSRSAGQRRSHGGSSHGGGIGGVVSVGVGAGSVGGGLGLLPSPALGGVLASAGAATVAASTAEAAGGVLGTAIPNANSVSGVAGNTGLQGQQQRLQQNGGGDLSYSSCSNTNTTNANANATRATAEEATAVAQEEAAVQSLRTLLTSTLSHSIPPSPLNCPTSSSSTTAVFYGSILYARTKTCQDAYLYGRALALNGENRRAVWIMSEAGLLRLPQPTLLAVVNDGVNGNAVNGEQKQQKQPSSALRVEAALLAAECMVSSGEWDEAARILEVVCCYPPPGHVVDLDQRHWQQRQQQQGQGQDQQEKEQRGGDSGANGDDDGDGANGNDDDDGNSANHEIDYFGMDAHLVRHQIDTGDDVRLDLHADLITGSGTSNDIPTSLLNAIHPISRLSCLLAVVHDELGNPSRSATFLRAALRIDPRNVQALEHCLQRRIMDKTEERALVLSLRFDDVPGGEFLRDIYLAKLGFVPGGASLSIGGGVDVGVGGDHPTAAAADAEHDENVEGGTETALGGTGAGAGSARKDTTLSSPPGVILQQQTPNLTFLGGHGGDMNVMDESSIRMEESHMAMSLPPHHEQQEQIDDRKPAAVAEDRPAAATTVRVPLSPSDEINRSLTKLTVHPDMSSSSEILSLAAIHSYSKYDLPLTLSYCQLLEKADPYCQNAAFVHISALASLGYKRPLFQLAHRLVDANPKAAKSWYAVGSYYYACGRYDLAQRHFCRAARLDPRSSECWIAFGCSFAACDESDQALASYRAASRLNPGDHYPLLYMGMEYVRTNHPSLAEHFLRSSWRVSGFTDPLVRSEMGVLYYRKGEWKEAMTCFVHAVRLVAEMSISRDDGSASSNHVAGSTGDYGVGDAEMLVEDDVENTPHGDGRQVAGKPPMTSVRFAKDTTVGDISTFSARRQAGLHTQSKNARDLSDVDCIQLCSDAYWEPTIFSLGHSYRKIRMLSEAAACFEKCLSLCPGKASSYSALAYTRHLSGDLDGAIEAYHQSLSRQPDDPFCSEMLMRALNESLSTSHFDPAFDAVDTSHEESFLSGAGHGSAGGSVLSPHGRAASAAASASFLSGYNSGRASTSGISSGNNFTFESSVDVDMSA